MEEMQFPYGNEEVLFSAAWATADMPNTDNAHSWVFIIAMLVMFYIAVISTHYCNG
jgi:hypothetical protein